MNPALSIVGRDAALPHDAPIRHGGGLDAARRRFPSAPEPWIDLSTGVSPRAYPLPAIAPEAWTRLPDENALAVLEAAAAKAYRAPARIEVVAGAGTQAFIQCLPRLLPARRVATLGFTYAEHAASWRASGARASVAATLDELADSGRGDRRQSQQSRWPARPAGMLGRVGAPHGPARRRADRRRGLCRFHAGG